MKLTTLHEISDEVFCLLASNVHSVVPLPLHLLAEYLVIGLAYQGKKDIVFRFIIEYSSLRDFYRPLGHNNRSIFM